MLSNGTPMFSAGDEFLRTQRGNNNPYNQDNETTWMDWDRLEENRDMFRFCRLLIHLRKTHPTIARSRYWREDVRWYGTGRNIDMSSESRRLAFCLDGASQQDVDFYVMINAHWEDAQFQIQEFQSRAWKLVVDTARGSPQDVYMPGEEPPVRGPRMTVRARSIVVLMSESREPHPAAGAPRR
jgi:glycogen operon protein